MEVGLLRELFDCEEYLPEFSIVAELDGEIVGHVISTRGWVGDLELLGLGPIGVVPRLQRHGIGSALMQETIARANAAGERGIALLGGPEYYSRFGFVPSGLPRRGTALRRPGPGHFQLLPLALWPGGVSGTFRYAAPFGPLAASDGIPWTGRPSSPIGRGSGLKIRVLWVRVPPGAHVHYRAARLGGRFRAGVNRGNADRRAP